MNDREAGLQSVAQAFQPGLRHQVMRSPRLKVGPPANISPGRY